METIKIIMGTIGYYIDKHSLNITLFILGYFLCHIINYWIK
jgi:hypothetical protein